MSAEITIEEWMGEMQRLADQKPADVGHTAIELAAAWDVGLHVCRARLSALQRAGRLIVGTRKTTRLDGHPCTIPVYAIKPGGQSTGQKSGKPAPRITGHGHASARRRR
jgi:predicted YcjX-like family ATPase